MKSVRFEVRLLRQSRHRPDNTALVLPDAAHVEIAVVCDGEDMRRHFTQAPVCVHLHLLDGVDGQQLVWVDRYQNGACVCLQTEEPINHHTAAQLTRVCACVCVSGCFCTCYTLSTKIRTNKQYNYHYSNKR